MAQQRSQTSNYILGLMSSYGYTIVSIIVGFFLTPFTLSIITREEMGIVSVATTILAWNTLFYMGISGALNLELSQESGRDDNLDKVNRLLSTGFFTQLLISTTFLLVALPFIDYFPVFFNVSDRFEADAILTMLTLIAALSLARVHSIFSVTLFAYQQIHIDNLIKIFNLGFSTAVTIWALLNGWGMVSIPMGALVANTLSISINAFRAYRLIPGLDLRLAHFSWGTLKGMWGVGIWTMIGSLAGLLVRGTDQAVVGRIVSLEAVTVFFLTASLYTRADQFLRKTIQTSRPMLSRMIGQGRMKDAYKTYRQMFQLSTGLSLVVVLAIWAGNKSFVEWWVGAENYGGNWLSLAFALNLLANMWTHANRTILLADIKARQANVTFIFEAVLNLVLSIIMTLQLGIVGTALSTVLANLLTSFLILPFWVARMFDVPYRAFFIEQYTPIVRGALLMLPLTVLMKVVSDAMGGFGGAFVGGGSVGLCGLVILWFLVLDARLKRRISGTVERGSERVIGRKIILYRG